MNGITIEGYTFSSCACKSCRRNFPKAVNIFLRDVGKLEGVSRVRFPVLESGSTPRYHLRGEDGGFLGSHSLKEPI